MVKLSVKKIRKISIMALVIIYYLVGKTLELVR